MSFIRCDRGDTPTDHHTLALALAREPLLHSLIRSSDLDAMAAGGKYLRERGYHGPGASAATSRAARSSTIGRTRTASWSNTSADGDMFDNTLEPGWAPFAASGLAQWGPPATEDFLGICPSREAINELRSMVRALATTTNSSLTACSAS